MKILNDHGCIVTPVQSIPEVVEDPQLLARSLWPPLDRRYYGVVVGVGSDTLTAIPKYDMDGKYLGDWGPDDVPQMDMSGQRAGSSVQGEKMVGDDDEVPTGTEHLSSLKEGYLQVLARDAKLEYRRLNRRADMSAVLQAAQVRRALPVDTDLR